MATVQKNISRFVHYSFSLFLSLSLSHIVSACHILRQNDYNCYSQAALVRSQRKALIWTIARLSGNLKNAPLCVRHLSAQTHIIQKSSYIRRHYNYANEPNSQYLASNAIETSHSRTCNDKNYLKGEISSSLKLIIFKFISVAYLTAI